jgi:hypothetical protein
MKIKSTLFVVLLLLVLSSCHHYYTSSSFTQKTSSHKLIAILPPQVAFTGNLPKNISIDDLKETEEKESKIFQEYLYNNLLKRGSSTKTPLSVGIQPYSNTLALLQKNGIGIRESWTLSDRELAQALGVDAVVRASLQKQRIMSDLASASIELGKQVIDAVTNKTGSLPVISNKTNNMSISCSIISDGETLWNDSYTSESYANLPEATVIDNITDNFAKHFPYKKKA